MLVTGGGRGIGAATALQAAARGYAVGVNYARDDSAAKKVVEQIQSLGGVAVAIRADVGDETQVRTLFDEAEDSLGL